MKKLLCLLLVFVTIFALCSCGSGKGPEATLAGEWECVKGLSSCSVSFDKNGKGTLYLEGKTADISWDLADESAYENTETGENIKLYSYNFYFDGHVHKMVTEEGGKSQLMLKWDEYTLMFEKK